MEQSEKCLDKCDISVVAWVLLTTEGAFAKNWMALTGSGGEGPLPHCLVVCVLCLFVFVVWFMSLLVRVHTCLFFGRSWAQHPNLHFVGGAGLITLTNTFLVELGSAPWYRLGPTPQLPCSLAPSMRGQAVHIWLEASFGRMIRAVTHSQ